MQAAIASVRTGSQAVKAEAAKLLHAIALTERCANPFENGGDELQQQQPAAPPTQLHLLLQEQQQQQHPHQLQQPRENYVPMAGVLARLGAIGPLVAMLMSSSAPGLYHRYSATRRPGLVPA